jgi:hypothetical protein
MSGDRGSRICRGGGIECERRWGILWISFPLVCPRIRKGIFRLVKTKAVVDGRTNYNFS